MGFHHELSYLHLSSLVVSLFLVQSKLQFLWQLVQADDVSFSYPNDDSAHFLLLGDAVESHELIELTSSKDPGAMTGSAGRFLCRTPIKMVDPDTGQTASFTTSFSFRIYNINSSYQGDGMTFLISPDNYTVGSYGEQLGAFTPSHGGPNDHTFAVEFDTWQNSDVHDPNGNHVGLDATNVTSFSYGNASSAGVQLNDGSVVTAWIRYDGALQNLQVRISVDSMEPVQPLIDANVSFASFLDEYMYVGFSGSTGLSNEAHTLMSWTFSSWGLSKSSSVSSSATGMGVGTSRGKSGSVIVVAICLTLVLVVLLLGLLSWRMTSVRVCGESYFRRAKYYESKSFRFVYPRPFSYKELYAATKGFSERQRLSRKRGVGTFYKGVLVDSGVVVAVKHVARDPQEGLDDFLQEIRSLCSLPHHNLVPIHGWCLEKGELLLVYEFVPNESLDRYLFGDEGFETLSWSQRYHIVVGISAGLAHLHEGSSHDPLSHQSRHGSTRKRKGDGSSILHRDVKASNVMLDNNFNARLGDYGLGRLVRRRKTAEEGMVLEGTFGCIAPEVVETGRMTTKADVFSFGILVLEVACGRRAIPVDDDAEVLVDMLWELTRQGCILDVADKKLKGCYDVNEMECLLHLGLLCTLPDPAFRPSMSDVRSILHGDCPVPELPPSPKQSSPQQSAASHKNGERPRAPLHISIDELLSS